MHTVKAMLLAAFAAIFCLAPAAPAQAADGDKIGIVDFQKLLSVSDAGKQAQERITEKGREFENELKNLGERIEEERKKLEREALVMSKEMREEKEREFRIMVGDFKALQKKRTNDFQEFEQRILAGMKEEILAVVEEIGQKQGYRLILEKRGGGVVYAPDAMDITDEVVQKYNAATVSGAKKKQ